VNERDIFIAAVQIADPGQRAAYVDQACAGSAELRRRACALLDAFAQAGSFLEQPAHSPIATVDQPTSERPGTIIGPYKLLEQIGEGGFAVVFMAEQQQPVRRKVALKVLKPGMDTRQVVARFEAERQALAIMDHPNIARVFDGGATPLGRPYFVMELVKGVPITEFCDQNRFRPRQRLELFVAVCQAVQHAHQKGVIHRDLKPSNVLVTVHDTTPVVKVIDFGVAKAIGQELTDKTVFTGFAQMIGTPLYMSPEQAGQSGLDTDTRSDIYALGVLLYELLTGTTPFDKERLKTAGYEELRRIIREEEPARPSTRISTLGQAANTVSAQRQSDPRKLRRLLRGELDWVVMKCLEKDRNRRYETALDLATDLRRHLDHEPVLACPPTLRYRLGKYLRKHRGPAAAGVAVLVALLGGLTTTTIAYLRARAAENQARQSEAEARATVDFLTYDVFGVVPQDAPGERGREVTIREALDAAAPKIGPALGQDPRLEAAVRHVLGTTYRFLEDLQSARYHLEQAVALRRRVLGDEDPATLTSQHSLCAVLHDQGRLPEAEALCRAVLGARRRLLPAGDAGIPSSLTLLGLILTDEGDPERAEPMLREALDLFGKAFPEGHWRTANAQALLGECLSAQGRFAEAEPPLVAACRTLLAPPAAPRHHTRRAVELTVRLYEAWGKNDKAEQWREELRKLNTGG
jgi:serine/threonine protein kinase